MCRFISCSESVAALAGLESPRDLIGKDDSQLPWSDRTQYYYAEEQLALSGHEVRNLQTQQTADGRIKILVCKSPLYNAQKKIVGTIGSSIDLTHTFTSKKTAYIDSHGVLNYSDSRKLTPRETSTLKLLLLGYSNRVIAAILCLSVRTVDGYVEAIKIKLDCDSRGEIIKTAITHGLIHAFEDLFDQPPITAMV